MSTKTAILLCALALAGCTKEQPARTQAYDQCARAEIFQACMRNLPAGPQATKYNDWDEVVRACGDQAQYMSVRPVTVIKEECRAGW